VTAVEIEVSPFEYGNNQKKVIATATELGIAITAYSCVVPLKLMHRQLLNPS